MRPDDAFDFLFSHDGPTTRCRITRRGKAANGTAQCAPGDAPDATVGRWLAWTRAIESAIAKGLIAGADLHDLVAGAEQAGVFKRGVNAPARGLVDTLVDHMRHLETAVFNRLPVVVVAHRCHEGIARRVAGRPCRVVWPGMPGDVFAEAMTAPSITVVAPRLVVSATRGAFTAPRRARLVHDAITGYLARTPGERATARRLAAGNRFAFVTDDPGAVAHADHCVHVIDVRERRP